MEPARPGQRLNWVVGNTLPFVSLGTGSEIWPAKLVAGCLADPQRLAATLWLRAGVAGDLRGVGTVPGNFLSGGELDSLGGDPGRGAHGPYRSARRATMRYPLVADFRSVLQGRSNESAQP
jgi:hypothetical protein